MIGRTLLIQIMILLVVACAGPIACHPSEVEASRYRFSRLRMGARAEITIYASDEAQAVEAAEAAFQAMADLEEVLSDWSVTSEVARIRSSPPGVEVAISQTLDRALDVSEQVARESHGAFDVTCGSLTRLWRKAREQGLPPSPAQIEHARSNCGYRAMVRSVGPEGTTVRFDRPGMELDFGGIGKGLAVDDAMEVLRSRGLSRSLVTLGGDLATGDPPPGQNGWRVARPAGQPLLILVNAGVATSGAGEQHLQSGGRRLSHLLDPRTGEAIPEHADVTVVASSAALADAWASVAAVVGCEEAQKLAPASIRFLETSTARD